jgi:hypothetical protein
MRNATFCANTVAHMSAAAATRHIAVEPMPRNERRFGGEKLSGGFPSGLRSVPSYLLSFHFSRASAELLRDSGETSLETGVFQKSNSELRDLKNISGNRQPISLQSSSFLYQSVAG